MAENVSSPIPLDEVVLDKINVAVATQISSEFAQNVEMAAWRDHVSDHLVWELRGHVLAEKLAEQEIPYTKRRRVAWEFPRSTWQFFKACHPRLLGWFTRRWPVKTERHVREESFRFNVRTKQFATFPASPLRTPDKYQGRIVVRLEQSDIYDR